MVVNQNLLDFLCGTNDSAQDDLNMPVDIVAAPSNENARAGCVIDGDSFAMLKDEISILFDKFFTQFKVCQSLLKLLDEIQAPTEVSDFEELKKLVYSELRWLKWKDSEVFAFTCEEEMKWLKQLAVKAIGRKKKNQKQIQSK